MSHLQHQTLMLKQNGRGNLQLKSAIREVGVPEREEERNEREEGEEMREQ